MPAPTSNHNPERHMTVADWERLADCADACADINWSEARETLLRLKDKCLARAAALREGRVMP